MRLLRSTPLFVAVALLSTVATTIRAQGSDGQLAIHGYLTQGAAVSHGAQFYGMTDQVSTDFRYAALQFRYDRKKDGFLLQVNNRRLGSSPITNFESAVNLNWAFYERRGDDGTSFRFGRIPVPRGIYNEERSIGVVLPFYRAPVIFYDEGAYFSETIDGVVLSHTVKKDSPWNLDFNLYGGGWSLLSYDQSGPEYTVGRVRADNGIGTQLWLNTPIEGVRFGTSAQTYRWRSVDDGSKQQVKEYQASFDATRPTFMLRAETELMDFETDDYYASYVQLGHKIVDGLWINTQAEYAYERNWSFASYTRNFDWHKTAGVGLNYKFSPTLVLKAEHHWNRGIQVEQPVADPAHPPVFNYTIVSLSASF